jgi:hypothetical protein
MFQLGLTESIMKANEKATENEVDLAIGYYLKYAPDRPGGGGRKAEEPQD